MLYISKKETKMAQKRNKKGAKKEQNKKEG